MTDAIIARCWLRLNILSIGQVAGLAAQFCTAHDNQNGPDADALVCDDVPWHIVRMILETELWDLFFEQVLSDAPKSMKCGLISKIIRVIKRQYRTTRLVAL